MKSRFVPCLVIIFILSIEAYCQYDYRLLSNYQLPDLDRRTLIFDGHFSTRNDKVKLPDFNSVSDIDEFNNVSSQFNLDYRHSINRIDLQRFVRAQLGFVTNFGFRSHDNTTQTKNRFFVPKFNYDLVNRKYKGTSTNFFEIDIHLSSLIENFSSTNGSSIQTKDARISGRHLVSIPIKIGKGRLQPIVDARHAIFILEKLDQLGKLNRVLSEEEIITFANLISSIKNQRFFDRRLKRIYEIEQIDGFLQENDLLQNPDIIYFSNMSDMWDFGGLQLRNTGTRYALAFYPEYQMGSESVTLHGSNTAKLIEHAVNIKGGFEYANHKVQSMKWQNTIEAAAYIGETLGDNDVKNPPGIGETYKQAYLDFQLGQTWGYFPSTRTDVTFNYSLRYLHLWDPNLTHGIKTKNLSSKVMANFNYYISPEFRLNISTFLFYKLYGPGNAFNSSGHNYFDRFYSDYLNTNVSNGNNTFQNKYSHISQIKLLYSWL